MTAIEMAMRLMSGTFLSETYGRPTRSDAGVAVADALNDIDQELRAGLVLQADQDLRSHVAGERPSIAIQLPTATGWLVLGRDRCTLVRATNPSVDHRSFADLRNDAVVRDRLLHGPIASDAATKSERLLRDGLLGSDRSAFRALEEWTLLLETKIYAFATRLVELLDEFRLTVRAGGSSSQAELEQRYFLLVALLGRASLLSTEDGASHWLADMAKSFKWQAWTPSFPLVRERSLWCACIGAKAAAQFGPRVVDDYQQILGAAEHPIKALDALLGLMAIGIRHSTIRSDVRRLIELEYKRFEDRSVVAPEFFALGFDQAIRILSGDTSADANGSKVPSFRTDPFLAGADGDYPAFAALTGALDQPAWKYISPISARGSDAAPTAAQSRLMFLRAWGPSDGTPLERTWM
jgi:hypothetical protein